MRYEMNSLFQVRATSFQKYLDRSSMYIDTVCRLCQTISDVTNHAASDMMKRKISLLERFCRRIGLWRLERFCGELRACLVLQEFECGYGFLEKMSDEFDYAYGKMESLVAC